jgi:hypothetical protein
LPAAARCAGLSGSGGVVARRTAVRAVAGRAGRAVDGAGLAVVRTGLAVEPAGLAADRAGLAVEPAGLAADRAGLAADRAGLAADRAGLAVEPAGLAVELADVAADRAFGFAGVAADGFAAGAAADRARGLAGVAADSAGGGVFDAAADCGLDPAAGRPVCRAWPPVRAWGMAPPCSVVASHLLTRPPCVVTHPG